MTNINTNTEVICTALSIIADNWDNYNSSDKTNAMKALITEPATLIPEGYEAISPELLSFDEGNQRFEITDYLLDALYEILGDCAKRERPDSEISSFEEYDNMMAAFWSDMPEQLQEYACIGEELTSVLRCNRWHNNFGEYFGNKNSTLTQSMNKIINHYKTKTGEYYYVDKIGSATNPLNIANPNRVNQIVAFIDAIDDYKTPYDCHYSCICSENLKNITIKDVDFFDDGFYFNIGFNKNETFGDYKSEIFIPINSIISITKDENEKSVAKYDILTRSAKDNNTNNEYIWTVFMVDM